MFQSSLHKLVEAFSQRKKKPNLLPEFFCGAEAFTSGAITSGVVSTETHIGHSITGPGQRALERVAQEVKRPRYNDVIVETHQRGHTEHPNANTFRERHSLSISGYTVVCEHRFRIKW